MNAEDLAAVARQLPYRETSASEVEELRARVLASAREQPQTSSAPRRRRWAVAAIAAGVLVIAAGAAAWTLVRPSEPAMRATVEASSGAQFNHTSTWLRGGQSDEVVRLKAGRVHLEVHKLATGERFRVVAGDGEVEVRGTAFDVEASEDHLESVHVDHGWVEVRPSGLDPVLLGAGEQWHAAPAQPALVPEPSPPPALVLAPSRPAAIPRTVPPPPQLVAEDVSDEPVSEPDQAPPPSPQEAAFARGWDALRGGQPAQAVEAFHEAWGGAPDGPIAEDAQFWEAVALARAHRTPEAISSMQLFLGSHPRSVRTGELSVMLGWLLLDSGATEEARSRFDAARTDPNPAVRDGARKGLAAAQGSSSSTRPP